MMDPYKPRGHRHGTTTQNLRNHHDACSMPRVAHIHSLTHGTRMVPLCTTVHLRYRRSWADNHPKLNAPSWTYVHSSGMLAATSAMQADSQRIRYPQCMEPIRNAMQSDSIHSTSARMVVRLFSLRVALPTTHETNSAMPLQLVW